MKGMVAIPLTILTVLVLLACSAFGSAREDWKKLRERMVTEQLVGRDIKDPKVLDVMRSVKRHLFVPKTYRDKSYQDRPLPIGEGQTISQPYIVAKMTELIELTGQERVLEIGTGSGYQAAVLGELAKEVYTIEIVEQLCIKSKTLLSELGYQNIHVRCGDGYAGWPEKAPFDAIILTAAPKKIPEPLKHQLRTGGLIIAPVGDSFQELIVSTKTENGFDKKAIFPVRFVPMTGRALKE